MSPLQFVGYAMIQATSITSLVQSSKITSGTVPSSSSASAMPSINYYKLSGDRFGLKRINVSINCRDTTQEKAEKISSEVLDLFVGTQGLGTYADVESSTSVSGFSAYRISLVAEHNVIPETSGTVTIYNSPVDISIIF